MFHPDVQHRDQRLALGVFLGELRRNALLAALPIAIERIAAAGAVAPAAFGAGLPQADQVAFGVGHQAVLDLIGHLPPLRICMPAGICLAHGGFPFP